MTDQPPHVPPHGTADSRSTDGASADEPRSPSPQRRLAVGVTIVLVIAAVIAVVMLTRQDNDPVDTAGGTDETATAEDPDAATNDADNDATAGDVIPDANTDLDADGQAAQDGDDARQRADDRSNDRGPAGNVAGLDGSDTGSGSSDGVGNGAANTPDFGTSNEENQPDGAASERPDDFESIVTDAIDAAFGRFRALPVSAEDADVNATAMSIHETQVAINTVTNVDASRPIIVIRTSLDVGQTIAENDASQGARGICNVVIADTFAWSGWIDGFQILASNGDVLSECTHPAAR